VEDLHVAILRQLAIGKGIADVLASFMQLLLARRPGIRNPGVAKT
jgi:hypothetical protein